MANRHLGRTITMQALYQWDFRGKDIAELQQALEFNIKEFAPEFNPGNGSSAFNVPDSLGFSVNVRN